MFTRIAVVNRGEAARRLIHAVRELNAERRPAEGGALLETVALYTEGSGTRRSSGRRTSPIAWGRRRPGRTWTWALERALVETGADAAWAGWGFVAEDPAFAGLCERLGVTFIGPTAEAMRELGDKIGAKLLAEEAGVPVAAVEPRAGRHPGGRPAQAGLSAIR